MRRLVMLGVCGLRAADRGLCPAWTGSRQRPATLRPRRRPATPRPRAPAGAQRDADIYTAVLRRYLTHPTENSFPGFKFPVVYVLSRTEVNAGGAGLAGGAAPGPDITAGDQEWIISALRDVATVQFIADRSEVVVNTDGCAQVRDGGILIVLAPPKGDDDRVEVGIHGFVACLGATWFTYVVQHEAGGWTVTGTTGPAAIA